MAEVSQRRSRYWLMGGAGWLGISAICLLTNLGPLEADLADRSQIALATAGLSEQITDGEISFTGEIATLRGTVSDEGVREQIADVVADVRGVRRINNEIGLAAVTIPEAATPSVSTTAPPTVPPALRPPSLQAVASGTTITLTGEVPSQDVADRWLEAAQTAYGADNVVDQLTISEEIAVEDWLAGGESLRLLAVMEGGSISIGDGALVAAGLATDQAAHDEILARLTADLPGVTIEDRIEIAQQAPDEIVLPDLSGIRFETNSAAITTDSIPILDEAVQVLASFPAVAVEVAGHTDSDGNAAANLALSQARADAVLIYLVDHGIAAARLTAVGYGEAEPLTDNATPEGKAQNRRIEFKITEGV